MRKGGGGFQKSARTELGTTELPRLDQLKCIMVSGQATMFVKAYDKGFDALALRRRTFEQRGRCPFTRCEGGVIAARTLPFKSL
jgi:hypothetical protein